MLKKHLDYNNISTYKLSKGSGVPYSSVNDLVNGKVNIDMLKYKTVSSLARFLGYSSDQFYLLCKDKNYVFYKNLYGILSFSDNKPKLDIYNLKDEKIDEEYLPDLKENIDLFLSSLGRYTLEKKYKENLEKELVKKLYNSNWEV